MDRAEPPQIGERYDPPVSGWRLVKRYIRAAANTLGTAGITLATGGHAWFRAPFAVEYTERDMPLRGLHPDLEGFRLVQIADLHTGKRTPVEYLRRVMHHVNEWGADLVCVTGDLITSQRHMIRPACDLLSILKAPVVVTLGNHDYSIHTEPWVSSELADEIERELTSRHMTVLRDRATRITRGAGGLWLVGLEDYWFPGYSPDEAFSSITSAEPVIALSHNPDTAVAMARRGAQWTLAGHTHGGQLRIPVAGSLVLPIDDKRHDQGLFPVGDAWLYVSRGVGGKLRVRFRCPPEVTRFTLKRAG